MVAIVIELRGLRAPKPEIRLQDPKTLKEWKSRLKYDQLVSVKAIPEHNHSEKKSLGILKIVVSGTTF